MEFFSLPAKEALKKLFFDLPLLSSGDTNDNIENHPMFRLFLLEGNTKADENQNSIIMTTRNARGKYQGIPEKCNPLFLVDDIYEWLLCHDYYSQFWKYKEKEERNMLQNKWNTAINCLLKAEWWYRIFQIVCMRYDICFSNKFALKGLWCNPLDTYKICYSLRDTSFDGLVGFLVDVDRRSSSLSARMDFDYRNLCRYCIVMKRLLVEVWEYVMFGPEVSFVIDGVAEKFVKELLEEHENHMKHFGGSVSHHRSHEQ